MKNIFKSQLNMLRQQSSLTRTGTKMYVSDNLFQNGKMATLNQIDKLIALSEVLSVDLDFVSWQTNSHRSHIRITSIKQVVEKASITRYQFINL